MPSSSRVLTASAVLALLVATPIERVCAQRIAPSAVLRLDATQSGIVSAADTSGSRARINTGAAKRGAFVGSGVGLIAGTAIFVLSAADKVEFAPGESDRINVFLKLAGGGALAGALIGAAIGALFGG